MENNFLVLHVRRQGAGTSCNSQRRNRWRASAPHHVSGTDEGAAYPLAEDGRHKPSLHEPRGGFGSAVSIFQPTAQSQTHGAWPVPLSVNISHHRSKMTASNTVVRAHLNARPTLGLKANPPQPGCA